VAATNQVDSKR
jgi:hypothetical protein